MGTIADLNALRDALTSRRDREAHRIAGSRGEDGLDELVRLHLAVQAVEAVIAEHRPFPRATRLRLLVT